jgi:Flp pilus assembly protein TadG
MRRCPLRQAAVDPARRGQATLELAIVLPVLALLTMGIIELGMMLQSYIVVVNLGREGARVAVDGATNQEIRSVLFLEGSRRLPTYTTDAAVLVVRGRTANSDGTGGQWTPDPCNPSGWTLRAQAADVTGTQLDGVTGYQFVLVEVQFIHRTITRLPFASDVPVSTRAVIRTAATNVNGACP